jgi:ABC-type transport system involved in multi-copper enzyme maturation permease subunit
MGKVTAIAMNTFKEAIRNRILYVILIFALILIGFSGIVSELTIASKMKIIKNLGFMSINLFGVAIAVFVGVSLVYNELEKKTIYTIVSKPIARWQFLLGKYFGLLLTVWVNVLIMTVFFLATVHYYSAAPADHGALVTLAISFGKALVNFFSWSLYPATANIMHVIAVTCLEMAIITAFAVLFSSFSTPTLSMFFTVLTFVAGRLNEDIVRFTDQVWDKAYKAALAGQADIDLPFSYYFATAAAHIIPNLQAFATTAEQAIYEQSVRVPWDTYAYGVVYTAGVLCLSMLIFHRRNFK